MENKSQKPEAGTVKKILEEDEDKVVGAEEIARIFRIYLGREATEDENARFEGIRESEWKILEKYVKKLADIDETDENARIETTKNAQDFAIKDAKITGKNILENKKMAMSMPGMTPMANSPVPMPMDPGIMTPAGAGQEMPEEGGQEYLQDGEKFLVQFK